MSILELKSTIAKKLGVAIGSISKESFGSDAVRFNYKDSTYRVTVFLGVEKVDGYFLVADDDAKAIEVLLRGEEWNGEGLPPVGCECMARGEIGDDGWYECKIIAHTFFNGYDCAVFQTKSTVSVSSTGNFKPLRSEADKKRDAAVAAMEYYDQSCESIYDAIAAGKIPGVKLEDL